MKHDQIIDDIVKRLLQNHAKTKILRNIEYNLLDDVQGEGDIILIENTAYAIEVKGRDTLLNELKADKQCWKDYAYIIENYNPKDVIMFYAFTDSSMRRGYNVVEKK